MCLFARRSFQNGQRVATVKTVGATAIAPHSLKTPSQGVQVPPETRLRFDTPATLASCPRLVANVQAWSGHSQGAQTNSTSLSGRVITVALHTSRPTVLSNVTLPHAPGTHCGEHPSSAHGALCDSQVAALSRSPGDLVTIPGWALDMADLLLSPPRKATDLDELLRMIFDDAASEAPQDYVVLLDGSGVAVVEPAVSGHSDGDQGEPFTSLETARAEAVGDASHHVSSSDVATEPRPVVADYDAPALADDLGASQQLPSGSDTLLESQTTSLHQVPTQGDGRGGVRPASLGHSDGDSTEAASPSASATGKGSTDPTRSTFARDQDAQEGHTVRGDAGEAPKSADPSGNATGAASNSSSVGPEPSITIPPRTLDRSVALNFGVPVSELLFHRAVWCASGVGMATPHLSNESHVIDDKEAAVLGATRACVPLAVSRTALADLASQGDAASVAEKDMIAAHRMWSTEAAKSRQTLSVALHLLSVLAFESESPPDVEVQVVSAQKHPTTKPRRDTAATAAASSATSTATPALPQASDQRVPTTPAAPPSTRTTETVTTVAAPPTSVPATVSASVSVVRPLAQSPGSDSDAAAAPRSPEEGSPGVGSPGERSPGEGSAATGSTPTGSSSTGDAASSSSGVAPSQNMEPEAPQTNHSDVEEQEGSTPWLQEFTDSIDAGALRRRATSLMSFRSETVFAYAAWGQAHRLSVLEGGECSSIGGSPSDKAVAGEVCSFARRLALAHLAQGRCVSSSPSTRNASVVVVVEAEVPSGRERGA